MEAQFWIDSWHIGGAKTSFHRREFVNTLKRKGTQKMKPNAIFYTLFTALLLALAPTVWPLPVRAAGNSYTIDSAGSCNAFLAAIGGSGRVTFGTTCQVLSGNLPAGDTLTISGGWTLRPQNSSTGQHFINQGTINITSSGTYYGANAFDNAGTLNFTAPNPSEASVNYNLINNSGVINFAASIDFFNSGTINNTATGTITNEGVFDNGGVINNAGSIANLGVLSNSMNPFNGVCGIVNNTGTLTGNPPIDKCPPTASPSLSPTANDNGWNDNDVIVSWNWSDNIAGSGLDEANCTTSSTNSSEGVQTLAATCQDLAGNIGSASYTVRVDKTAPTISAAATTQPNTNGWYNSNVTVHFTCADGLSGVTSCPLNETLSSEGDAVSSTAQTITDLAGNSSAASNVVTVKLDKTAPVVTVTGVSNGASYPLGSVPTAGCNTADALSGVATQATISVTGGGIPLGADGTGSFTATCSGATDNAGNNGSASVTYRVVYNWTGFFQPVDNLPTVNTVNAGQAIPVKFSLGGNYGLNIFATGYPASQQVSCGGSGGGSSSPIEETVTAGNSSLQYDPGAQRYIYVWKTDKAWAGTCRQLIVKLIDGTEQLALFQFNGKGRNAGESDADGDVTVAQQQIFLPLVNNQ